MFVQVLSRHLKYIKFVGGFPYEWKIQNNLLKVSKKALKKWQLYSALILMTWMLYSVFYFIQTIEFMKRYEDSPTLMVAFYMCSLIRLFSSGCFLIIGDTFNKAYLVKKLFKQALKLLRNLKKPADIPKFRLILKFKIMLYTIISLSWIYFYIQNPTSPRTEEITLTFDCYQYVIIYFEVLDVMYSFTWLTQQCLSECFSIFYE